MRALADAIQRVHKDCKNKQVISDVVIGILKEGMDLVNYVIILGKSYLWNCRHKDIKSSISHFQRILEKKYETEKYIAYKSNRITSFRDKWKSYEELFLSGWLIINL